MISCIASVIQIVTKNTRKLVTESNYPLSPVTCSSSHNVVNKRNVALQLLTLKWSNHLHTQLLGTTTFADCVLRLLKPNNWKGDRERWGGGGLECSGILCFVADNYYSGAQLLLIQFQGLSLQSGRLACMGWPP